MPIHPTGNLDFLAPIEALNALQRNWQIQRAIVGPTVLTASFTASVLYAAIGSGASLNLTDTTTAYQLSSSLALPFGGPFAYPPPGGQVVASLSTTGSVFTVLYK